MQYKKTVALYVRLSEEDEDVRRNDYISESRSIKNQKSLLRDFVKSKSELSGLEIVEYKDDGYSGTNFNRPKFIALMSEVRKGSVAAIVVKDFSRLGRDYLDSGNFLDKIFPAYGVRFIAINDRYDSNDHIGQTTGVEVGLKNIVNEMYSKDLSVKYKSAWKTRCRRGEHNFPYPFYGYQKDPLDSRHLIIDEEAAEIVRLIFQCSIDGMSSYQTAAHLNEKGILSPSEYKKNKGVILNGNVIQEKALWDSARILAILKDERYLGKMIYNRRESTVVGSRKTKMNPREEWIVKNDMHEGIVDRKVFDSANKAMKERTKRAGIQGPMKKRTNLFTCPYCDHKLQFYGGKDQRKYLYCVYGNVNRNKKCKEIKYETEAVKQTVLYTINTIAGIYTNIAKKKLQGINKQINGADEELRKLTQKLNDLKSKNRNVYVQFAEEKITKEQFLQKTQDAKCKIKQLECQIETLKCGIDKAALTRDENNEVTKEFEPFLVLQEFDKETLQSVLEKIYVDENGKVELVFRRKDILEELGIA